MDSDKRGWFILRTALLEVVDFVSSAQSSRIGELSDFSTGKRGTHISVGFHYPSSEISVSRPRPNDSVYSLQRVAQQEILRRTAMIDFVPLGSTPDDGLACEPESWPL